MEKVQYYTRTAQWLHWIMAIIFIAAWLIGFYSGNFLSYEVDSSFKGDVITLHKNIATTIIFLLVVRIFWRYTHPAPELPDTHVIPDENFSTCRSSGFVFHADCPTCHRLFI